MTIQEILNLRLDGIKRPHKGSVKIDETGTGKDDPRYDLILTIDYTGWTVQQVLDNLASGALWISRCRVLRTMTKDEVMATNGKTVMASDMGRKPRAAIDVQASFMAMFAAASPEEQVKMLEELKAKAKAE